MRTWCLLWGCSSDLLWDCRTPQDPQKYEGSGQTLFGETFVTLFHLGHETCGSTLSPSWVLTSVTGSLWPTGQLQRVVWLLRLAFSLPSGSLAWALTGVGSSTASGGSHSNKQFCVNSRVSCFCLYWWIVLSSDSLPEPHVPSPGTPVQ